MAIMLAMAVLIFVSHRAHATEDAVLITEACHAQVHVDVDDHHHGDKQRPMEQSSYCAGICADFLGACAISLSPTLALSYAALPVLDQSVVRSLTPDSPHRPPRA